jgi:uncharacterized membrane protein
MEGAEVRLSWLFVLGFALVIMGMVMVTAGSFSSPSTSVGIVVFVGPIPIVFGKGSNSTSLVIIALVAAIGTIIAFSMPFLVSRRAREEQKGYS